MNVHGEADEPVLDREALLQNLGGDWSFVAEVIELFMEESPQYLAAIREAVERGDAEALEAAAHTLKGAAANLHTDATCAAAQRLEEVGREIRPASAAAALPDLERELKRALEALDHLRDEALLNHQKDLDPV